MDEETLSPSLSEIDDLGDEMLDEEHSLKLDPEAVSDNDNGTFPVEVLGMLDDHNRDSHGNIEKQTIEKPTPLVDDLVDAVSNEDDDDDSESGLLHALVALPALLVILGPPARV